MLRGRVRTTTYLYDDLEHPERVTGAVESPVFTEEDRALLLALAVYEGRSCSGCQEPVDVAWHSDMDGWWATDSYVCIACTARNGGEQVSYTLLRNERPDTVPLRPFSFDDTTRPPLRI